MLVGPAGAFLTFSLLGLGWDFWHLRLNDIQLLLGQVAVFPLSGFNCQWWMPRSRWLSQVCQRHGWGQSQPGLVPVLRAGGCATCGRTVRLWRQAQRSRLEPEGSSNARFGTPLCWERLCPCGTARVSGSPPGRERGWQRPRSAPPAPGTGLFPGAQHVWGSPARHPGPCRRRDMPGGCPLPQGTRAAPKQWAALLQPRWWSLAESLLRGPVSTALWTHLCRAFCSCASWVRL